jgi:hypothetical protein
MSGDADCQSANDKKHSILEEMSKKIKFKDFFEIKVFLKI